jgi:hypothetical protein
MADFPEPATPLKKKHAVDVVSIRAVNPLGDFINDPFASAWKTSFFGVKTSTLSVGHAAKIEVQS